MGHGMNKKKKTGTDWERLRRMRAGLEPIDTSDIPPLDKNFWKEAAIVIPGGKTRITIRIDTDIYRWFTSQGASHYQTHINAVLRSYVQAQAQKKPKTRIAAARVRNAKV